MHAASLMLHIVAAEYFDIHARRAILLQVAATLAFLASPYISYFTCR